MCCHLPSVADLVHCTRVLSSGVCVLFDLYSTHRSSLIRYFVYMTAFLTIYSELSGYSSWEQKDDELGMGKMYNIEPLSD